MEQKLCECGCGDYAKPGNKYINGHNQKGKTYIRTDKTKKLLSKITTQQFSTQKARDEQSERLLKFNKENPEAAEEMSKRRLQYHVDHPEAAVEMSELKKQQYKDNPTWIKQNSDRVKEYYIDNPEARANIGNDRREYFSHDENREKMSAIKQSQNYNKGEWTGFTDKSRPHLIPIKQCIHTNGRFDKSEGHHITNSIVIFIPSELHKHIKHNIKTGDNMGEMNMLALQYINGGL